MKKIKKLCLSNNPEIIARAVVNEDKEEDIEDKQKKQFITLNSSMLHITFEDDTSLYLYAPKDYAFDGATIPFGIGKGDMKILIPALFHDIICDKKYLVDYDRALSSKIFYELLLYCHKNRITATIMYLAVDIWQRGQKWGEDK